MAVCETVCWWYQLRSSRTKPMMNSRRPKPLYDFYRADSYLCVHDIYRGEVPGEQEGVAFIRTDKLWCMSSFMNKNITQALAHSWFEGKKLRIEEPQSLKYWFFTGTSLNTFCGWFQPHLLNWWERRLVQPLWKTACRFFLKTNNKTRTTIWLNEFTTPRYT